MNGSMRKDSRFDHIANDPRFKRIPKQERKVKIDKRFQSMFSDSKFKVKYTIDKRGRPVNHTNSEDLRRFYELSSEESGSDSDNENDDDKPTSETDSDGTSNKFSNKNVATNKSLLAPDKTSNETKKPVTLKTEKKQGINDDPKSLPAEIMEKLHDTKIDYARGEAVLISDSSSDESSDEDSQEQDLEHGWGELDRDAERTDEVTHRLAVCHMDWDRIRASDLMVLLSSFLPPGGLIHSVTIYPSEFGLERMKKEDQLGPIELCSGGNEVSGGEGGDSASDEDQDKADEKYHNEKLRQYQLNRLKYFYAVVVCDSRSSANKIYTECDGLEYESSATRLDLRFIPDDTTFDQEPREICNQLPDPSKYEPRYFTTTALQQAKVDLTWDETDPARVELTQKVFNGKADDVDLQAYLASSSGEEEQEIEDQPESLLNTNEQEDTERSVDPISKYRALLQSIEENEQKKKGDIDLEITWGVGLKDMTQKLVNKKLKEGSEGLTPFQQMIEKKKEKRMLKREAKKKKMEKAEDGDDNLYSDDEIPSDIDMNDPYFAEEFKDVPKKTNSKKKKKKEEEKLSEETEQKRAELELLLMDEDDTKKHFSLKNIQEQEAAMSGSTKKRKKFLKKKLKDKGKELEQDDFEVNVNDERFSALFSSHHFNIDPADPHYRKTKGMELLRTEKLKRRATEQEEPPQTQSKVSKFMNGQKKNAELSMLVKSVKQKTKSKFKS